MKVPAPLQNLYADLRDKRMLSIALILVVAIIAVPFLLGGSGEEDIPPPPPSAAASAPFEGDEQLDPVVLAEAPGLRDFRQRLENYPSSNPFKPRGPAANAGASGDDMAGTEAGVGGDTGAGADTGAATDTGSDGAQIEIPSSDDGGTTDPGTDPGAGTDPSSGGGTGDGSSSGDGSSGSSGELISYRIDVRVGPVGNSKVYQDVEQLEFLPDRRHPLVEYIEADTNGNRVAFIVNPAAAAVKGDAECVRSRKDCQYLVMSQGDEMFFIFEDRQYRIELKDIIEHREPYAPGGTSEDEDDEAGKARRDLAEALGG